MKNKLVFVITLAIIAGISAAVLYSRGIREHIDAVADARGAKAVPEKSDGRTEGIGGMNVSGMEIVQGEKGQELWRLFANEAVMSEEGGDIVVRKPHLTYYMRAADGGREELYVTSDAGDVNQKGDSIHFTGNVIVKYKQDVLSTNLLIYDGPSKRLNCPEKSWFESPGMEGTANTMSWHLDDNTLHSGGGVNLKLDADLAVLPTDQKPQATGPKQK